MQKYELISYNQINKLYNKNYDSRLFTDFEILLFNNKIQNINMKNIIIDVEKLYSIINYCDISKDYKNYLKYTSYLLKLNDSRAYNKLLVYLLQNNNNCEKDAILQICLIGSKSGNMNCIINLGILLYNNNDTDNALKYLKFALNKRCYNATITIATIYLNHLNIELGFKYLLFGIKKNIFNAMSILEKYFNDDDLYIYLLNINDKNELIQNKINELKQKININYINSKLNYKITYLLNNFEVKINNLQLNDLISNNSIVNFSEDNIFKKIYYTDEKIFQIINNELEILNN